MAMRMAGGIARDLNTLFETGLVGGDSTDGQLVERFRTDPGAAGEAAFAALIRRHGPMVLRVCRGVLNDEHDAQDAFQATFLVLVRKAGSIRNRCSVASWLYGVAHRVASRAKVDVARRRTHERRAASLIRERQDDAIGGLLPDATAIDEEIRRLPEKYRAVVVLCYLEGLSQDQAAVSLGWPAGTVRGRLSRARELMRSRLSRRGFVLPVGAVTAGSMPREEVSVPVAALISSMPRPILLAAAGKTKAVSDAVVALAGGTVRGLIYAQLKVALLFLGLSVATASVVGLVVTAGPTRHQPIVPDPPPPPPAQSPASSPAEEKVEFAKPAPTPEPEPAAGDDQPDRESTALAFPLEKIVVDGDLGDWPKGIHRYPVRKFVSGAPMGFGGLEGSDLATSPDLSPEFSVGYNLKEQLLYVGVVVRDDKLVVGHTSHLDTDAVEIYVDGLRSEKRIGLPASIQPYWKVIDLSELPVQQYVALPGSGRIYGTNYDTNPILLAGDLRQTRTKMAYRRVGDVTTYEWAIEPFDRYPDQPTRLEPGKRIGFDLAVVDKDVPASSPQGMNEPVDDRIAWLYWGPQWNGIKVLNAGNLGDLILAAPR